MCGGNRSAPAPVQQRPSNLPEGTEVGEDGTILKRNKRMTSRGVFINNILEPDPRYIGRFFDTERNRIRFRNPKNTSLLTEAA